MIGLEQLYYNAEGLKGLKEIYLKKDGVKWM